MALETKVIRLSEMVPSRYRLLSAQAESTFRIYEVMDIVNGDRLRPDTSAMTEDVVQEAFKWDKQNALARQALLACLPPSELTNVYQMKLASEIWTCLKQEQALFLPPDERQPTAISTNSSKSHLPLSGLILPLLPPPFKISTITLTIPFPTNTSTSPSLLLWVPPGGLFNSLWGSELRP
jgi:hypothetical protein